MRSLVRMGLVAAFLAAGVAWAADEEVARLIADLGKSDAAVRERAQAGLAAMNKRALLPLVRALGEDETTRVSAMVAIQKMGAGAAPALPYVMLALGHHDYELSREAQKTLVAIGEPALNRLVKALGDRHIRYQCINALAEFGPNAKGAIPGLVALMESDETFRDNAADTLAKIGPDAYAALKKALTHSTKEVRMVAAVSLSSVDGQLGPELVEPLVLALQGKDRSLASKAVDALGKIGPPAAAAVEHLKKRMEWADEYMRPRIATALMAISPNDPSAIKPLVEAVVNKEYTTAIEQLKKVGKAAVQPLLAHAKDRNPAARARVAKMLGELEEVAEEGVPALIELLKDTDSMVRLRAAYALGKIGPKAKAAVPELNKLTADPSPDVVEAARSSVKQIGP